jgi:hypothetical protein
VTIDGVLKSAANIDPAWIDFPVVDRPDPRDRRPVTIINDADCRGHGRDAVRGRPGQPGVVIFLTLGTGVGSGVFVDGKLVPNTEFGQMEIRGRAAERGPPRRRGSRGLSWKAWAADLDEHLDRIYQLTWPNLMILGGGVSKNADKYIPRLTVTCPVVPASCATTRDHRRGDRRGRGEPGRRHGHGRDRRAPRRIGAPTPGTARAGTGARRAGVADPRRIIGLQATRPPTGHPSNREPASMTTPTTSTVTATRMVIGGETVDAADGQTFDVVNPATGQTIATAPLGGPADVDRAVEAARRAFDDRKGWANWAAGKRGRSLAKFAALIKEHTEELAQLESRNVGKPITGSRGEITGVSLVFDYYAGAANKIYGQTIPVSKPGIDLTLREPIGVVGLIVPWNFPLLMASWKARSGAGRRQHRDPQAASLSPLTALRLGELALEAASRRRAQRRDRAGGTAGAAIAGIPGSARSPSPARPRPARRSCGWPRTT